ncbi:Acg family FMN-binding oxidoreductase [Streptomyces sp. NBC_01803]|uniref:Acg family FMN-binding oxidoreductase n=1 Tax=Streptomyces sp. NBC_01803 TaxID=2975946 RepID=UPI002DD82E5B|nr:hypothetical protein [Streptomyces sp. NBC_01803]WSA47363.1 hypothetical protein OIE51_26225 [Streptomyces sp. NBC_01803]
MERPEPDAATLEKIVSAAIAAPSIHNTQPWRFRGDARAGTVLLEAVPERRLTHTDPAGRALHLSAGAALFNLRVAAAHFGWHLALRLLPDPATPGLLAALQVTGTPGHGAAEPAQPPEHDLYDAVWHRHSSRFPYANRPLPQRVAAALTEAARYEGASLRLPDAEETQRLLRITADGEWRNAHDPERRAESRGWLRDTGSFGLPPTATGPQDVSGHLPVRDFTGAPQILPTEVFETNPTIAVLSTAHDRRADWLHAGEALEHALLVATAHSVRTSLLHQALEWPDLRAALRDPRHDPGPVQMLIRLGYGPAGEPTARRPVRQAFRASPRSTW